MLRKILTICLLRRIWKRLEEKIPINQAAYQPGRSTTEQVFSIKIICEKAIASSDYKLHLLLLDMSKAFDTVKRDKLFEHLENILKPDELHLLSIITNRPTLRVKVNQEKGSPFETYLGIMQGDCLSAILFIYYLAECLNHDNENTKELKYDLKQQDPESFNVDPYYADDTTYAATNNKGKKRLTNIEEHTPKQLSKYNLTTNHTKTEKFEIPRPPPRPLPSPSLETLEQHRHDKPLWSDFDYLINYHPEPQNTNPDWRTCKLLGSCLDTEKDIQRRKNLVTNSMKTLNAN